MGSQLSSEKEKQFITMGSRLSPEKKKQWMKIMAKVNEMRASDTQCDFTIKVDEKSLPVHRLVIRAASDYFDKMLSHDTMENQKSSVTLRDVNFTAVQRCVDFMYTGEIEITRINVNNILHVASMFQLDEICKQVTVMLKKFLNPAAFFEIRDTAVMYNLEGLITVCDEYAQENHELIAEEENFSNLDVHCVIKLIRDKTSVNPNDEDSKLAIILKWINADLENRRCHLSKMTAPLNLAKISPSYGLHVSEYEAACYESSEFMKDLYTARMKGQKHKAKPAQVHFPGIPNSLLVFDLSNKELKRCDPSNGDTKSLSPLHDDLDGGKFYTSCILGQYCYVLLQNKKTFRYDITKPNKGWETRQKMTHVHDGMSCVTVGDQILVVGGGCMEKYCESEDKWLDFDAPQVNCDQSSLAASSYFVFCVGGSENGDVVNTASKLAIREMNWSHIRPALHKRATPAVVFFNDILYVAGGIHRTFLNLVEAYDIYADTWTELSPLKSSRNLFRLCVVNDKIFAVGKKKDPLSIETYDLEENVWKSVDRNFDFSIMGLASVPLCL